YNPDQLGANTTDIVPGLFTQIVSNNKILIQDYGEWYYLLNGGTSIPGYAQLANRYISYRYDWFSSFNDLTTGNGFDDYPITGQSYFENSYLRLKPWETIRNEMSKRQGADRANAEMYFRLATIMKDYQSAKLVDFYNSIPYFDAFQGNNQTTGAWYPVYDDPKAIYESIITELGHLVDSLPVFYNNMDATAKTILAKQDIVFGGNINKWVQYTNALRIKYLVRISGVDAAFAQSGLQAALTKPLLDADLEFKMWAPVDVLGGGTWQRGLYENTFASFIPGVIMKRLNYDSLKYQPGIDDPRLPVLAMPTKYHDYRSITFNIDQQTPLYDGGDKYYPYADNIPSSLSTNAKSMYNIVTLSLNSAMPVYVFSRTEQDLLLAEIALKGLANTGKLPGDHISDAVVHSVNYWYRINQLSTASRGVDDAELYPTKPSDAAILAWATVVRGKFDLASGVEDKMEILMQQKYIHLNLLAPYELWAELRRTGHPKLEPFVWHGSIWKPFPERVRYPASEQKNNTTNFAKVASDNNLTSKIFWVPSNRTTDLYWSDNTFK
ncbi:MAG: SusD/RagB family nutrient-binding outer membrane lipoprotein, partial [Niabella sp.]|nr:SusD/RagB family nutrient-binding outer membrane lipoprotein [Niabella sp.]